MRLLSSLTTKYRETIKPHPVVSTFLSAFYILLSEIYLPLANCVSHLPIPLLQVAPSISIFEQLRVTVIEPLRSSESDKRLFNFFFVVFTGKRVVCWSGYDIRVMLLSFVFGLNWVN